MIGNINGTTNASKMTGYQLVYNNTDNYILSGTLHLSTNEAIIVQFPAYGDNATGIKISIDSNWYSVKNTTGESVYAQDVYNELLLLMFDGIDLIVSKEIGSLG